MSHIDITGYKHGLDWSGQVQQTQQVGYSTPGASYSRSCLFMSKIEVCYQPMNTLCFFEWIEILSLHVFDQSHSGGSPIINIFHDNRHFLKASYPGSPKTAFSCNDFINFLTIPVISRSYQNRLHDTLFPDRLGQFIQSTLIHARSRLIFSRFQPEYRQSGNR